MDGKVRAKQTKDMVLNLCHHRLAVRERNQMWASVYNPGDHFRAEKQVGWLWSLTVKSPQEYFQRENQKLAMKLNQKQEEWSPEHNLLVFLDV